MRLLDIILAMDDDDRRALSAITIERTGGGEWQARLSICRSQYGAEEAIPGVSLRSWVRVPDQYHPLDLDELRRDSDVRVQAVMVQLSGLIGQLDMARYDSDRRTSYLIKSHAGSQQERTRWLMGLRERPENTIWEAEPRFPSD